MTGQDGVKTEGRRRSQLCHDQPVRPARNFRKRRSVSAGQPKTEHSVKTNSPAKVTLGSKPLKTSNEFANMTIGHTLRSPAESHEPTECIINDEITYKSPKAEPPLTIEKTVTDKVEPKLTDAIANPKLTGWTPVRRSVRKTSTCIMAEKLRDLEMAVREQREDGLAVGYFEGKGRGLVATRPFSRGQFVVEYAGELVGVAEARERERRYAQDPNIGCYMYYFRLRDQHYCIDATAESGRLGRLLNHSRKGNVVSKALSLDGPRLVMLAAHDIAPGEELTLDYGDRSKESLRHHPWLAF